MKKKILFIVFVLGLYLSINNVYAYDKYKFGDQITFSGELYHVIENSDENQDYITILKDEPLTIQNLYKYGRDENDHLFVNEYVSNFDDLEKVVYEYGDKYGGMAYYTSETCSSNLYWSISNFNHSDIEIVGCNNSYTKSDVKKVIDNWSKSFSGNLKEVDGYKARILTYDDLVNKLGFVSLNGDSDYRINLDTNISWFTNFNYPIWISNTLNDSNKVLIIFGTNGTNEGRQWLYDPNDFFATVRPVLNVYKSKIGNEEYQNSEEPNEENIDNTSDKEQNTTYKEYKKGDRIIYKNLIYYVIEDSNKYSNYIYLLRDLPLSQEQLKKYSGLDDIENRRVQYYVHDNCDLINNSECDNKYKNSIVKKIVDNWAKSELNESDLVEVDGYKAKILSYEDLLDNYPFKRDFNDTANYVFVADEELPKYLLDFDDYWLMNADDNKSVGGYFSIGRIEPYKVYNKSLVRPTIYLNKEVLEKKPAVACKDNFIVKKNTVYNNFYVGDEINFKGQKYHVIEPSFDDKNYVTLLKDDLLTNDEIMKYGTKLNKLYDNILGYMRYYETDECNDLANQWCYVSYNNSDVKKVVENWAKNELNEEDLVEVNGYKVRIIRFGDEIDSYNNKVEYNMTDYYYFVFYDGDGSFSVTDNCAGFGNYILNAYSLNYSKSVVRPVINLKKSVLGDRQIYNFGEKVEYLNEQYYVVRDSDENSNYVVLLKNKPLTQRQIYMYDKEKIDIVPYYYSNKCDYPFFQNLFVSFNENNCINDYNVSYPKEIVDNWVLSNFETDELVEVEGYKARLINLDELINYLGYDPGRFVTNPGAALKVNELVPKWVYENAPYWTMSGFQDDNVNLYYLERNGNIYFNEVSRFQGIRPVINLNKCLLDGGCDEEDIYVCVDKDNNPIIDNNPIDDNPIDNNPINENKTTIIDVENTLNSISKFLLIISALLIIIGSIIFINNYIKSKKNKNLLK